MHPAPLPSMTGDTLSMNPTVEMSSVMKKRSSGEEKEAAATPFDHLLPLDFFFFLKEANKRFDEYRGSD